MKTRPVVLHTDDNEAYGEFAQTDLARFGVDVETFNANEKGYEAAKAKVLPEGPYYDAVIADYETYSSMTGGQLIAALVRANLDGRPLVKEILVLSSSADRLGILQGLREAFAEQQIGEAHTAQYMDTVQVFDKQTERRLAELYVALHTLYPEETKEIKRVDMIHWAGFEVNHRGDTILKDYFELDEVMGKKFDLMERKKLTLPNIIKEIVPFCHRDEGKTPGMVK